MKDFNASESYDIDNANANANQSAAAGVNIDPNWFEGNYVICFTKEEDPYGFGPLKIWHIVVVIIMFLWTLWNLKWGLDYRCKIRELQNPPAADGDEDEDEDENGNENGIVVP